jgi:uncharacterized protein YdeI (YjbR/CyaY-like superfamily)
MAVQPENHEEYIAASAPFAHEILLHLRSLVYQACPHAEETIKWGFPHFEFKGAILCSMAAFKQHCAFGFRLGKEIPDPDGRLEVNQKSGMGNFGQIRTVKDLPADEIIIYYIREAMLLNEQGVKVSKSKQSIQNELVVPEYLAKAIVENEKARTVFDAFSPGKRKEYVEWITSAKTEETRLKRLDQALEWIAEGKSRNWKYEKC